MSNVTTENEAEAVAEDNDPEVATIGEHNVAANVNEAVRPEPKYHHSRLQILQSTFYDKDVSFKTITKKGKDFSLQKIHHQGANNVCTFFACIECMSYQFYLSSKREIKLSVMHGIKTFPEVMQFFSIDPSVTTDMRAMLDTTISHLVENGPSIQHLFTAIMCDGVYNDPTNQIPFNLDPVDEKMIDVDISSALVHELEKYTIEDFEVTSNAEKATHWLESGPIVGSLDTYGQKFNDWKKSLKMVFSHTEDEKNNFLKMMKDEPDCGHEVVGHTVIILGKGARKIREEEVLCFLIKNSCLGWGENGYAMVGRKEFTMFGRPIEVVERMRVPLR